MVEGLRAEYRECQRIKGKNKSAQKSINSYLERIEEHKKKIQELKNNKNISEETKKGRIHHWESEIEAFEKNIEKKTKIKRKKGKDWKKNM